MKRWFARVQARAAFARAGRLALYLVLAYAAGLAAQPAGAPRKAQGEVTEERLALVIGNAAYRLVPLDNPVNDARLIAGQLEKAGFKVFRHENLDRSGMGRAMREFGDRLNERTVAVFFYAGHALQLRDRNFLVPVDAEIRNEDEIELASIDIAFMLSRMSAAKSRINVVILDACRDNPYANKTRPARGLAQMDAPVNSYLAFATAPGKVSDDAGDPNGKNSLYTAQIARHLLTPGLPVETLFKRVRDAVVTATKGAQVPWDNSSLLSEFAFVPGVAQVAKVDPAAEAAGEIAFWNSIEGSNRPDEFRGYLRQYPNGRFVERARERIAALTPGGGGPVANPSGPTPPSAAASPLPRAGDTWRYRVQDEYMFGDLFVTATVEDVTEAGVTETWTSTSDAKVRSTFVPLKAGFHPLPGLDRTPPEFAPYLLARGVPGAGTPLGEARRRVDKVEVAMKARVAGEEDVVVQAGRFRAVKVVLSGEVKGRGASAGSISVEQTVWYVPEVKRAVKYAVTTKVAGAQQEATVFELIEYKLR